MASGALADSVIVASENERLARVLTMSGLQAHSDRAAPAA
jgi:hypothetical protein